MSAITSLDECLNGKNPFCRVSVEETNPSSKKVTNIEAPIQPLRPRVDYSDDRTEVYSDFIQYFGDQLFTKDKSTGDYSIYMMHVKTGLMDGSRVLIAIVHEDHTVIGNMKPLSALRWVNFQTRHIKREVVHAPKVYPQKKGDILNSQITRVKKTELSSTYKVEGYPLVVELKKKENSIQEWSERNKLFVALETYQCGVSFA
jgi:hypothetical protein